MEYKLDEVEFSLKDLTGAITGALDLVAFVSDPAMEEKFQFFSKTDDVELFAKIDLSKKLITGPVLIPNKRVKRFNRVTKKYYKAWFSEQTVRDCLEYYSKNSNHKKSNFEHGDLKPTHLIKDVFASEFWIVEDSNCDKAKALGWDVPKGTWMQTFKVENDEDLKFIQENLKGFSLEGIFNHIEHLSRLDADEISEIESIIDSENAPTNEGLVLEIIKDIIDSKFEQEVKDRLLKKIIKKINR